ncbi:hypothetical protein EDC01DRAFT_758324 [Geopyxis carbonaria]|nr:hypothetical protein EDC01DRAFT_758324 [Geopyxis carbonaria]
MHTGAASRSVGLAVGRSVAVEPSTARRGGDTSVAPTAPIARLSRARASVPRGAPGTHKEAKTPSGPLRTSGKRVYMPGHHRIASKSASRWCLRPPPPTSTSVVAVALRHTTTTSDDDTAAVPPAARRTPVGSGPGRGWEGDAPAPAQIHSCGGNSSGWKQKHAEVVVRIHRHASTGACGSSSSIYRPGEDEDDRRLPASSRNGAQDRGGCRGDDTRAGPAPFAAAAGAIWGTAWNCSAAHTPFLAPGSIAISHTVQSTPTQQAPGERRAVRYIWLYGAEEDEDEEATLVLL